MNNLNFYVPHNGRPIKLSIGDRVVEFELSEDWTKLHVSEMCDQCFGEVLDKTGVELLINYLSILKLNMK